MLLFVPVVGATQVIQRPFSQFVPTFTVPARSYEAPSARSHAKTGFVTGAIIGVTAATVFLIAFCSDADTKCGPDEIGRAVLFIALPPALVGALIGSLIRS